MGQIISDELEMKSVRGLKHLKINVLKAYISYKSNVPPSELWIHSDVIFIINIIYKDA